MATTSNSRFASVTARISLLLLAVCLPCLAQSPVNSLEGSWKGTLEAGGAKLRLVMTFTRPAGGDYQAVLDSIDQGATIPANKFALNGDKLRIDFEKVNGFYEGVLNKDGSEITGTWTQAPNSLPLTFKRAEPGAATKEDAKPAASKPFSAPIDVTIPMPPTAFQADGKTHLAYELHITNFSAQSTVTLARVEVLGDSGNLLARMEQSDLLANILLIGNYQAAGTDKLNLATGQMANVYVWVTLENPAKIPAALGHRITVKIGKGPDEITEQCTPIAVGRDIATISAP